MTARGGADTVDIANKKIDVTNVTGVPDKCEASIVNDAALYVQASVPLPENEFCEGIGKGNASISLLQESRSEGPIQTTGYGNYNDNLINIDPNMVENHNINNNSNVEDINRVHDNVGDDLELASI